MNCRAGIQWEKQEMLSEEDRSVREDAGTERGGKEIETIS